VTAVRPDVHTLAARAYGPLVAVGLSHRTAPVALRERAALSEPAARALLAGLRAMPGVSAAAVLSTCNRTELYAVAGPAEVEPLRAALAARGRLSPEEVAAAGFAHTGPDALAHLFRVAAGLDSLVLGETEIQHQVRRTAAIADEAGTLGELAGPFRDALATGRRVRRETGIGRGAVSTASVCVELARQALGGLDGRRALVLGAGAMAASAARALARNDTAEIVVANRTAARARRLAADLGGRGTGLRALGPELVAADLVVACTGAPAPVLHRAVLARAVRLRRGRPLVIVDVALPRDVDASVASLDGVVLLDIDDLRLTAAANRAGRALEALRGEAIVAREVARCLARGVVAPLPAAA
jgi:glutamyl-tRNA reductase